MEFDIIFEKPFFNIHILSFSTNKDQKYFHYCYEEYIAKKDIHGSIYIFKAEFKDNFLLITAKNETDNTLPYFFLINVNWKLVKTHNNIYWRIDYNKMINNDFLKTNNPFLNNQNNKIKLMLFNYDHDIYNILIDDYLKIKDYSEHNISFKTKSFFNKFYKYKSYFDILLCKNNM